MLQTASERVSVERWTSFEKNFLNAKRRLNNVWTAYLQFLWLFFLFPPTSLKHEFYGLTTGFTRLFMKTKYACYGLISLHVNFHDKRTKWTINSNIKSCKWVGERKKSPSYEVAGKLEEPKWYYSWHFCNLFWLLFLPQLQFFIIKITVHIIRLTKKLTCRLIRPWLTYLVFKINLVKPIVRPEISARVRCGKKEKEPLFLKKSFSVIFPPKFPFVHI